MLTMKAKFFFVKNLSWFSVYFCIFQKEFQRLVEPEEENSRKKWGL